MDSIKIKKRIKQLRYTIQREWCEYWLKFIIDNKYKDWNWDWSYVSENANLTMDFINVNPEKSWNWYAISRNQNITMKNLIDNPDKPWNWYEISRNPFLKDKEEFIERIYREHLAAVLIQNAYKNALVNMNCQIGINKIERDMVFAGVN